MNLTFPKVDTTAYTSPLQIARLVTEAWGKANLYCASCRSDVLESTPPNSQAVDFRCPECGENYQLKSGKALPTTRIVDAAYGAMITAIRGDRAPNLLYLHYELGHGVRNLFLVPRFFFTEHCIEKRKPLALTARRAGWVGCNIRLDLIAPEGRINLVLAGSVVAPSSVRERFNSLAPIAMLPPPMRGWTLAVLMQVHRIGKSEFTLEEVYLAEHILSAQFPNNNNVRPKIRQQLQVLRDLGIVRFVNKGTYRLLSD